MTVALTGFCVVGNIHKRAGFASRLESGDASSKWYFMQTDRWYLERCIYLAVGINISIASVLSIVYSPWWLAFTAFVGVAMVWFSVTGFCIMANGLYWLGAEPRLAPAPDRVTGGKLAVGASPIDGGVRRTGSLNRCVAADLRVACRRRASRRLRFA
ncbi:MAG: hypothetical protein M3Y05_09715 [Gemmatimonadota bacterium]|nr:hypothetical protein [Gemmatimonadota bacterium]